MPVLFFEEDIEFRLDTPDMYASWIEKIVEKYKKSTGDLSIIFTSNSHIIELNRKFLNHDYYTDVITFNYNSDDIISGDIFVSTEQVRINARNLGENFNREISRVMVHGVLHLLGFNDETDYQKKRIRDAENDALEILKEMKDGKGV